MSYLVQNQSKAVTSRGCAKAFIVCVLHRALEFVKEHQNGISFPFSPCIVELWLELAKVDCCAGAFSGLFYGTEFDEADVSTYWIDSQQYFTWWKNNVERKCKYLSLLRDATYEGGSIKLKKRAMYCSTITSLAANIRNYFDRHKVPSAAVPQVELPLDFTGLRLCCYTTLFDSNINTVTECYECNYMTIKYFSNTNPNNNENKQDVVQAGDFLNNSSSSNDIRMYRFSHQIRSKKRVNSKTSSSSTTGKTSATASTTRPNRDYQHICCGYTGSSLSTRDTAAELFPEAFPHHPKVDEEGYDHSIPVLDNTTTTTTLSFMDDFPPDFQDTPPSNGYSVTLSTESVTFPVTSPPIDETLDISDIDFDALICEGSEVDWIDDNVSDCTSDIESSFSSHNSSFHNQYSDSEEWLRPSLSSYSHTSSSSSNNSSYSNSNSSSYNNMNACFSKKLTLKRSFEDLNAIDTIDSRSSSNKIKSNCKNTNHASYDNDSISR